MNKMKIAGLILAGIGTAVSFVAEQITDKATEKETEKLIARMVRKEIKRFKP